MMDNYFTHMKNGREEKNTTKFEKQETNECISQKMYSKEKETDHLHQLRSHTKGKLKSTQTQKIDGNSIFWLATFFCCITNCI